MSLIPGANQLLGLSNAVRHGTMAALAGIGGRLAAFVVLVGLVVAGLGATLAASATALTVIKWVGVGYLAWLGISSLWQARQALSGAEAPSAPSGGGVWPLVGNEFVVAISNPKALLLFAALLPQWCSHPGLGHQLPQMPVASDGVGYVLNAIETSLGTWGLRVFSVILITAIVVATLGITNFGAVRQSGR